MKRFVLALAAALTVTTVAQAEPLKLRIQYAGASPGMFGPMLEGITKPYKHYGQSYVIESISMRGSGAAITALAAQGLDP